MAQVIEFPNRSAVRSDMSDETRAFVRQFFGRKMEQLIFRPPPDTGHLSVAKIPSDSS